MDLTARAVSAAVAMMERHGVGIPADRRTVIMEQLTLLMERMTWVGSDYMEEWEAAERAVTTMEQHDL